MDCKQFRKQHLAYLDDTLSGEATAAAQHHVMVCNGCAAHDALVRRSLMVARSLPTLEPSRDFQIRLRQRLATCRSADGRYPAGDELGLPRSRSSRTLMVVAASVMLGVTAVRAFPPDQNGQHGQQAALSMQPVGTSQPVLREARMHAELPVYGAAPILEGLSVDEIRSAVPVYVSPALLQAMATGNPVWPAAMIVEDAPMHLVSTQYSFEVR